MAASRSVRAPRPHLAPLANLEHACVCPWPALPSPAPPILSLPLPALHSPPLTRGEVYLPPAEFQKEMQRRREARAAAAAAKQQQGQGPAAVAGGGIDLAAVDDWDDDDREHAGGVLGSDSDVLGDEEPGRRRPKGRRKQPARSCAPKPGTWTVADDVAELLVGTAITVVRMQRGGVAWLLGCSVAGRLPWASIHGTVPRYVANTETLVASMLVCTARHGTMAPWLCLSSRSKPLLLAVVTWLSQCRSQGCADCCCAVVTGNLLRTALGARHFVAGR